MSSISGRSVPAILPIADGAECSYSMPAASCDAERFAAELEWLKKSGVSVLAQRGASSGPTMPTSVLLGASVLQENERRIQQLVARARQERDPLMMMEATIAMSDQSKRFDLAAKAVGKAVSAVDQLTKLN